MPQQLSLMNKPRWFTIPILLLIFAISDKAFAGNGTFTSTDGINGTFDFCVVLRFNATPTQIERIKLAFNRASQVLADATEGHHRFGTINIINNGDAAAQISAEFQIFDVGTGA